jgi:hypothetical protein
MKKIICALFLSMSLLSCEKECEECEVCDPIQQGDEIAKISTLLTSKQWSLKGEGKDGNNNNLVDDSENTLKSCSNFSIWAFSTSGNIQISSRTCPSNSSARTDKYFLTMDNNKLIYMTWQGDTYLLTFTNSQNNIHIKEIQLGSTGSSVWMLTAN